MPKSKSKTTKKRRRNQPQGNQQAELIVMLARRASLQAFFSHLGIFDRLALTVLFSSSLCFPRSMQTTSPVSPLPLAPSAST